jgi:hypothetical protein
VALLQADLRIRTKETGPNGTTIRVEYYKGTLWRTDPREGGGYRIIDSATRRVIIVDPVKREFWNHTYIPRKQTTDPSRTIVVEIEGRDTGERRQMFGYPAGRFITIQHQHTEYPDKPLSEIQEIITDGWYLDVPFPLPKEYRGFAVYTAYLGNSQQPGLAPKIKVTRLGSMPTRDFRCGSRPEMV